MARSVRRSQEADTRRRGINPAIATAIVAAVVAVVLGVTSLVGGGDTESVGSPPSSQVTATTADSGAAPGGQGQRPHQERLAALARLDVDDPVARGPVDAPVVMINYSDFQCQFCRRFVVDTEQQLIERYVDSGLMRIEWRDFPWIGDESTAAAHAARAAAAQGMFWEYNEALYRDQPSGTNSGSWSEDRLADLADGLGLDVERFRSDMNSRATADAVAADFDEGQGIGVTGTPTFLINGRPLVGAHPIDVFTQVIDEELAAVGVTP